MKFFYIHHESLNVAWKSKVNIKLSIIQAIMLRYVMNKVLKMRISGWNNTVFRNNRIVIKDSWFVNQESISWFHKPKICKTFIFQASFFLKYVKFETISTDNICLSISVESNEWNWAMKEKHFVNIVLNWIVIH